MPPPLARASTAKQSGRILLIPHGSGPQVCAQHKLSGHLDRNWQVLAASFIPPLTRSAAKAAVAYHTECLPDAFFDHRKAKDGRARLRAIEARVLRELSASRFKGPVFLNSLRCYGFPHSAAAWAFPKLWSEQSHFFRVCGQHDARVPLQRSLYLPYFDAFVHSNRTVSPFRRRAVRVLFIGSALEVRSSFITAMGRTPGARLFLIKRGEPLPSLASSERLVHSTAAHAFFLDEMSTSRYVACPPGDTPESRRIYQAIQMGAIPLVNADVYLTPALNWSSFAYPLHYTANRTIALPSAETERALIRGLGKAQARLLSLHVWGEFIARNMLSLAANHSAHQHAGLLHAE